MDKNIKSKGFTFSEFLVALLIMFMVLSALITFYVMTQYLWVEGDAYLKLQQKSRLAMEKMVRGVTGAKGIMEASSITLPASGASGTKITFVDTLGDSRSFEFSNGPDGDADTWNDNQLIYTDEDGNQTIIIASNLRALIFENTVAGLVEISLGMEEEVKGRSVRVDLYTQVKPRNAGAGAPEDDDDDDDDE